MTGGHTLKRSQQLTQATLHSVFNHLYTQNVMLEGAILKPNIVRPGLSSWKQESMDEVAAATVQSLLRTVPTAVVGIAFLPGRQSQS